MTPTTININSMKATELITRIYQRLPYPNQVEITSVGDGAVRFKWRRVEYNITTTLFVEEVVGGLLHRSDTAIVMNQLLKDNPNTNA